MTDNAGGMRPFPARPGAETFRPRRGSLSAMSRSAHHSPFDSREQVFTRPDPGAELASTLRIKKWRLRAEECRAIAETMRDPARRPLLAMAEHCERMAERTDLG
jgi:hypothetical protein